MSLSSSCSHVGPEPVCSYSLFTYCRYLYSYGFFCFSRFFVYEFHFTFCPNLFPVLPFLFMILVFIPIHEPHPRPPASPGRGLIFWWRYFFFSYQFSFKSVNPFVPGWSTCQCSCSVTKSWPWEWRRSCTCSTSSSTPSRAWCPVCWPSTPWATFSRTTMKLLTVANMSWRNGSLINQLLFSFSLYWKFFF